MKDGEDEELFDHYSRGTYSVVFTGCLFKKTKNEEG